MIAEANQQKIKNQAPSQRKLTTLSQRQPLWNHHRRNHCCESHLHGHQTQKRNQPSSTTETVVVETIAAETNHRHRDNRCAAEPSLQKPTITHHFGHQFPFIHQLSPRGHCPATIVIKTIVVEITRPPIHQPSLRKPTSISSRNHRHRDHHHRNYSPTHHPPPLSSLRKPLPLETSLRP